METIKNKLVDAIRREKWFYSEGAWVFIVKILNVGFTFLTSVAMARMLGTRGFGLFTQVMAIINVVGAPVEIGLPQLVVRETARLVEYRDWPSIRGLWQWSAGLILASSVVFIVGYPLARPLLGKLVIDELHAILVWAMLLVPLLGLTGIISSAIRGFHKVAIAQLGEQVIMPVLFLLAAAVGAYLLNIQTTPLLAIWYQVGAALAAVAFGLIVLARVSPGELLKAHPLYQKAEWIKSTLSLASINGMQIIQKWLSLIIVSYFVKYGELGVYRVAIQIAILADFGRLILYPMLSPQIAKSFANKDTPRLQYLATLSARIIIAINTAIYLLFIAFGKYFVNFFYGREFKSAYIIVIILITGQFFDSITGASSLFLTMTGFERETARVRFWTTALNLGLLVAFSSLWGIIGAAIASSITLILWNFVIWFLVKRELKVSCLPF